MQALWKFVDLLSGKMKLIGAGLLIIMALLTCVDVVGRFFRHPVFGSIELMSFMGALAVAMVLSDAHTSKSHIGVEIFVMKLPKKFRLMIDFCTNLISLVLFGLVTWKMSEYSLKVMESGEVSMNLELPEYLIISVVAFGFVIFALTIVKGLAETLGELRQK